jgi:hypothetical protein
MSARSFPIKLTMPKFSTKLVGAWVNMLSAGYANLDRGPPHVGVIDPRDFRYHDSLIGKVMRWTLLALRSKAYSRTRGQPLQKSLGYSIPTSGNQEKSPDKRERIMLATHVGPPHVSDTLGQAHTPTLVDILSHPSIQLASSH